MVRFCKDTRVSFQTHYIAVKFRVLLKGTDAEVVETAAIGLSVPEYNAAMQSTCLKLWQRHAISSSNLGICEMTPMEALTAVLA